MAAIESGFADLPQTRLHYVTAGTGPPLIIVPATISEPENWRGLIEFMAQRFTVYFFELPGHGRSTAFARGFTTDRVAATIGDWVNQLGLTRFSLMGFSFGGIIALKTLTRLEAKIDRIILLSPLVTSRALRFSRLHKEILELVERALRKKPLRRLLLTTAHNRRLVGWLIRLLTRIGRIETAGPRRDGFRQKLLHLPPATLDVLANEVKEILNFEPQLPRFNQPCYLAMSVNDPLLDYAVTYTWAAAHFPDLTSHQLTFPYHQPPQPPTLAQLKTHYQPLLNLIKVDTDH